MTISKFEKQKLMLSVILALVSLSLFNNFFLTGIKGDIKKNKSQIKSLNTDLSTVAIKVSKLGKIEKEREALEEQRDILITKFISKNESKMLGDKITENGKKYNIQLDSIKYSFSNQNEHEEFFVDVSLTTNYQNLVKYLNSIEKMEKYIKLRRTDISVDEKGVRAKLLLSAYIMPGEEESNEQE